jgi:hypothetical protein
LRYQAIETITYVDPEGLSHPVKEMREIPAYETRATVPKRSEEHIDEFATRPEVFGPGYEQESYRIWEANAVAFADACYDISKLWQLKVPPL